MKKPLAPSPRTCREGGERCRASRAEGDRFPLCLCQVSRKAHDASLRAVLKAEEMAHFMKRLLDKDICIKARSG